jgi:hypothetical protein
MTTATEAQKMRLAEAYLRLAREAVREVPSDLEAARDFGVAFYECPFEGHEDAVELLVTLCPPDEVPDILACWPTVRLWADKATDEVLAASQPCRIAPATVRVARRCRKGKHPVRRQDN